MLCQEECVYAYKQISISRRCVTSHVVQMCFWIICQFILLLQTLPQFEVETGTFSEPIIVAQHSVIDTVKNKVGDI
jgi:hypothetical protein